MADFFPHGQLRDYVYGSLIGSATAEQLAKSRAAAENDDGRGVIEVRAFCLRDGGTIRYTIDKPVSPKHVVGGEDSMCDCFGCNGTEVERVAVPAYVVGE